MTCAPCAVGKSCQIVTDSRVRAKEIREVIVDISRKPAPERTGNQTVAKKILEVTIDTSRSTFAEQMIVGPQITCSLKLRTAHHGKTQKQPGVRPKDSKRGTCPIKTNARGRAGWTVGAVAQLCVTSEGRVGDFKGCFIGIVWE